MDNHKYDDIIDLPHYQSKTRPKMSNYDRAAQFSPFAALTGHSAAIAETARLTERKRNLTDEEKNIISEKLHYIAEVCRFDTEIVFTYFVPDRSKQGGEYVTKVCRIEAVDEIERCVRLSSGERVGIDNIMAIEGEGMNILQNNGD